MPIETYAANARPIIHRRISRGAAALLGATALSTAWGLSAANAADSPSPVAAGGVGSAVDASAVQEVVVTARHRSENAQSVPIALSVIGGSFLAKTNTTNITQLSKFVPSVQFTFFNPRNANINIRGLGNNVGLAGDGIDPGVGFYIDQVYYSRPATATFDLVDIDQVEVLRGPQGTLFGKNTTAGAISLTTASPSFKPQAAAEVTGGDYGYFQAKASISGPLIADQLAGRLSVASTTRDGFFTNTYNNDKVDAYQNLTLRGQLLYTPENNLKIRVIADYSKQYINGGAGALSSIVTPPNGKSFVSYAEHFGYTPVVEPFARRQDYNASFNARQETGGVSAEVDWNLPKAVLTSVTAWRFWNWWPTNDADSTPLSILPAAQNGDYENQLSQEFRIASAGTNRVDYVGGLYFFREQIAAVTKTQYGDAASYFLLGTATPTAALNGYTLSGDNSFDTTSLAAFGQATWHITSKWNLTGGLRYTYDHRRGRFNQVQSGGAPIAAIGTTAAFGVTADKGDLSGQANLSYQAAENVLAYVNYARGYKSGGLNLNQLPPGVDLVVAPESIDSGEIGLKTQLFQHRVTLNADVFLEQDENYQANVTIPGTVKQYLANIPKVRSEGAEFDVQAQPTDNLSFYASGVYDDGTYVSYANAPCGLEKATSTNCDLSGRPLSGVSRWAASAGGEYSHPIAVGARELEAYAGVDYTYRSSLYSAATDSIYSLLPSLSLVNARLGLRAGDGRWDAYVWGKNILDAKYFTSIGPGIGNTGSLYGQVGDPATYGVTLRAHY